MTNIETKIKKISKAVFGIAIALSIAVLSSNSAFAAALSKNSYSPKLKIGGLLPECTYPQKSGGGACLQALNAQSCLNTAPFSPIGRGVSSEMCARGKSWCARNDPGKKHKRCKNVAKGIVKNHEGYDYSAACGTAIYAPCDGRITQCLSGSSAGIYFKCDSAAVCGKDIQYRFYHNSTCGAKKAYKKGQRIGSSGNVRGYPCHMHIEIREGGVLLDPMNSGFDSYVCGCKNNKKVNRLSCYTGGSAVATAAVDTGYEDSGGGLTTASADAAAETSGATEPIDEDCVYGVVSENYRQAGCFFCKPFRILFNTASVMAKSSYDALAGAVSIIVIIAFAIWLAVTILKFVSSFETKEPRAMINTLLQQTFRVLVIFFLLQGPISEILSLTLDPVFATGMKLAQLGGASAAGSTPAECNLSGDVGGDLSVTTDGGLSPAMGNGIICTIKTIQDQIIDIIAIARISWCFAWEKSTLWIPSFGYLFTAVGFFVAGFIMIFGYPFLLVDSVLKMSISMALFPAALGAFAFKITAHYLKKIWETFMNAIFVFIFLSLIILIISTIAQQYMTEIITDDVKNGENAILWFMIGAIKVLFVLFLGWAVLGEAKQFADKFAKDGVGLQDIGSKTGSAAAAVTKWGAKKAGKYGWKGSKAIGGYAMENAQHGLRKLKAGFADSDFAQENLAATDDDGNALLDENGNQLYNDYSPTLGNAWNRIRGRKTFRSYQKDSNGNVRETKMTVKNSQMQTDDEGKITDGIRKVTESDAFGSVTHRYDKNGNEQKTTTKTSKALSRLVNSAGEVDTQALNNFMQNSLLSEKEKGLMIMNQLINKRMGSYVGGSLDEHYVDRDIDVSTDDKGNQSITIRQTNEDGTKTVFNAEFKGDNRVMTSISTMGDDNSGVIYSTDGIVQCKTIIEQKDGEVNIERRFSVSNYYSNYTVRPVFIDGSVAANIDRSKILFSDDDMKAFGEQVRKEGNKAYDLTEFL